MAGLKKYFPEIRFSGGMVSPDEIDRYETYTVAFPGTSPTWIGTTVVGTSAQSKALVLINAVADYPRTLYASCSGSNDLGGTWTINGKDQFGSAISEMIGFATVVSSGTGAVGTKIFAEVTSGTFQYAVGSAGLGTPKLGLAYGGTAGTTCWFGLPTKIGAVSDVKSITHLKNFVATTLGGGTVTSTNVSTTTHAFCGTADLGTADMFIVTFKPTYNSENDAKVAGR